MDNSGHFLHGLKADAAQVAINLTNADILLLKIYSTSDLKQIAGILNEVKALTEKINLQVNDLQKRVQNIPI